MNKINMMVGNNPPSLKPIQSPCRGTCSLDDELLSCLVCKRTVTEIQDWSKYTDTERQTIMKELRLR